MKSETPRGVAREPSHTPGPWHWDCDAIKGDPLGRTRYRVTTTGKTITQCYYSSDDPHCEADARLIAAAPDLLAALKELIEAGDDCVSAEDGMAAMLRFGEAHDRARATITKAEGQTQAKPGDGDGVLER